MNNSIQTLIRWPIGCLIFLLYGCHTPDKVAPLIVTTADSIATEQKINRAFSTIAFHQKKIKTGDLITRTGNDFTSESLRSLNQRNQTFSHCGIASIENDSVFVYHTLGGEWNPDEKVRRDPLPLFANPYQNKTLGIFYYEVPDSVLRNLQAIVQQWHHQAIMFDIDFDLQTDERMYCAEFVYKSLLHASHRQLQFSLSKIKDFHFIGVDDLFLHPLCQKRIEIVYK